MALTYKGELKSIKEGSIKFRISIIIIINNGKREIKEKKNMKKKIRKLGIRKLKKIGK
jgi:hypothetical protein